MLLNSAVATETNCVLPSKEFSIKASPVAFDILSSKLYSDPILAIVRELLTNAYDSHKAAGTLDKPIHLNIPNYMNRSLVIRDYGTGLSKEDVLTLYTTFFDSTKSTSNDFTGCFGLGSKTPFSYTSSFTINSYFNGTKYSFIATKKNGYPNIILVNEVPTEEHNGLEVTIPVENDYDSLKFKEAIQKYLSHIPEIIVDAEVSREEPDLIIDNLKCYGNDKLWEPSTDIIDGISIKQGQNIYNIDKAIKDSAFSTYGFPYLCMLSARFNIEIEVPIGTFGVTPSREQISIDSSNAPKLLEILVHSSNKIRDYISTKWDASEDKQLNKYLANLKDSILSNKYFSADNPVWAEFYHRSELAYCKIRTTETKLMNVSPYSISRDNDGIIFSNCKVVIFLTPFDYKYPAFKKLCHTIINYSEEFLNTHFILMNMPKKATVWKEVRKAATSDNILHYRTHFTSIPYIKYMREFYDVVWKLNNMSEYDFDIEIVSVTKFMKEHPNHSAPKEDKTRIKEERTKVDENTTYIRDKLMKFEEKNDTTYHVQLNSSFEESIAAAKKSAQPSYTVVVINDELAKSTGWANEDLCEVTFRVMARLKNTDGISLLSKFVNQKLRRYRANLQPANLNTNVYILRVGKTCRKYFKNDYLVVTLDEVHDFIRNEKFKIAANYKTFVGEQSTSLLEMVQSSFKGRLKELILDTPIFKKIRLLLNIYAKYNTFDSSEWSITNTYNRVVSLVKRLFESPESRLHTVAINTKTTDAIIELHDRVNRWRRYYNAHAYLQDKGKYILLESLFSKEKKNVLL